MVSSSKAFRARLENQGRPFSHVALARLAVMDLRHEVQSHPAVRLGLRFEGQQPLGLGIGVTADPPNLAGEHGQLVVNVRGNDLAPLAGAKLQIAAHNPRLLVHVRDLQLGGLAGRRGGFVLQFHELGEHFRRLNADQPCAETVLRQPPAQIVGQLLLVNLLPERLIGVGLAEGKPDEEHFQRHAVGRELQLAQQRLPLRPQRRTRPGGRHQGRNHQEGG
jgi:hypothetical protein